MKILMALNGLEIGGAETHVVELSKEIVRRGHEVVMVSAGGVYQQEVEDAGITHYKVKLTSRSPKDISASKKQLKNIIEAEKPDIVHAHARIPGFLLDAIHKENKKSFVFVTTAHWTFDTSFLVKSLTRWGDKTLAVSDDLKKYLLKYYPEVKEDNIYISINGIDGRKFSKDTDGSRVAKEFSLTEGARRIVYVSRLNPAVCAPAYGLIEKIRDLNEAVPGIEILIVGDGDCYKDMKEKADAANTALGRRAIIMTGPRTDINEIHANGEVCVGVSRAILEPMIMEKKCVVAGQEGYIGILTPDKLDTAIKCNFTCRGCDRFDADIMTKDIIKLFEMNEEQSKETTDYGKYVVEKYYSVKKMADDNLAMYYDALRDCRTEAAILGYYGYGNSGDDALLKAVINDMKEQDPTFTPVVLSHDPAKTAEIYGVECADRFSIKQVNDALSRARMLILGGGSLIQDITSTKSLMYYLWCIKRAKKLGCKVMLYANGIGPITHDSNIKLAAKVLNTVDVITLRDRESMDMLKSMGVTSPKISVTADPAFSLDADNARQDKLPLDGEYVCMSLRDFAGSDEEFIKSFAAMADYIVEKYNVTPVFIPMQYERDLAASIAAASFMKSEGKVLKNKLTPEQLIVAIRGAKAVFAVRLHTIIFAAASGVPALGIEYDPKVGSFQKYIGQPYCIDPKKLENGDYKDTVDQFMSNLDTCKDALEKALPEMRQKAKENAKIATDLIYNIK